jgi:endoglucanase
VTTNPFVVTSARPLYRCYDVQVCVWLRNNPTDPRAKTINTYLGQTPTALGVGGDISAWIAGHAANAQLGGTLPVFVAYDIPNRDLGQYSAGGESNVADYIAWAQTFAKAIGTRPAVLIVEPDSIIHMAGLTADEQQARTQALIGLLNAFGTYAPNTALYLDAGDGHYNTPAAVAPWLIKIGIDRIRGFSVNVANYNTAADSAAFAQQLIALLRQYGIRNDIGYVIDVSRNGHGRAPDSYITQHPDNWWCNWPGSMIGQLPAVANPYGADALLWVKEPGVSDGTCGMAPSTPSGTFDPALALRLINGK